jgi:hypothetical protein
MLGNHSKNLSQGVRKHWQPQSHSLRLLAIWKEQRFLRELLNPLIMCQAVLNTLWSGQFTEGIWEPLEAISQEFPYKQKRGNLLATSPEIEKFKEETDSFLLLLMLYLTIQLEPISISRDSPFKVSIYTNSTKIQYLRSCSNESLWCRKVGHSVQQHTTVLVFSQRWKEKIQTYKRNCLHERCP